MQPNQQSTPLDVVIIPEGESLDAHAAAAAGLSGANHHYTEIPIDEVASHLSMEEPAFSPDYSALSEAAQISEIPYYEEDSDSITDDDQSHILRSISDDLSDMGPTRRISRDTTPSATPDEFGFPLGDPAAIPKPGFIANLLRPNGRVNRRLVAILSVVALGVFIILFTTTRDPVKQSSAASDSMAADTNGETPIRVNPADSALRSPEYVGPRTESDDSLAAARALGMAPMEQSSPIDPARSALLSGPPPPSVQPTYVATQPSVPAQEPSSGFSGLGRSSQNYAVAMRGAKTSPTAQLAGLTQNVSLNEKPAAAEASSEKSEGPTKETGKVVRLPQNTRIPMTLLEPLQSGMAATADARVDSDVRSSTGEILLRAGTTVSIPFLPIHTNGRMSAAPAEIRLQLPDGRTLALKGTVKGQDGLMGLPGKITKKGAGSTLGRVARGIARTGVEAGQRVLGQSIGSAGGGGYIDTNNIGLDDAVADRYGPNYNYGYDRAPKEVVDVPPGIRFQFIILQ